MGIGISSQIPAKVSGDRRASYSESPIKSVEKRSIDQHIFDESIEIACDWLEATGRSITKQEFDNLFSANYASYRVSDVERIFYDWQDYQQISESYYEEPEAKAQKQWELAESLHQKAAAGLIPKELLLKSESYTVKNPSEGKKDLLRQKLTGDYAASDIILKRYHKYLLLNHLLTTDSLEKEVTEERKINIALGFSASSQKQLSSFTSEVKKSHSLITETDIQSAADDLGISQYIFPEFRQEHLRSLVDAARQPEYYYHPKTKKVIVLGKVALSSFSSSEGKDYLEILKNKKRLHIGKAATNAIKVIKDAGDEVYELRELLINPEGKIEAKPNYLREFRELSKQDCKAYGSWLLDLVGDDPSVYNVNLLERAFRLQLGPGPRAIASKSRFKNLSQFYRDLGLDRRRTGWYTHWTFNTAVRHVAAVALANEGRVTKNMLRERIVLGMNEPSPKTIEERWGFNNVLVAAGLPIHNPKLGPEVCIEAGVRFFKENGKVPKRSDIKETDYIPSENTIAKYCGGIRNFQQLIIKGLEAEKLIAAA